MQNLEQTWNALDALALEVAAVNRQVGVQMLAKNRQLMLDYQQLAAEMAALTQAQTAPNGKPTSAAKQP
jgi:hypothetical protein